MSKPAPNEASLIEPHSEERVQQENAEVEAGVVATVVAAGETQIAETTNVTHHDGDDIIDAGVATPSVAATVVASSRDSQMATAVAQNQNRAVQDEVSMMDTEIVAATVVATAEPSRLDDQQKKTEEMLDDGSSRQRQPARDGGDIDEAGVVAATVVASSVPPSTTDTEIMMEVDSMDKKMPSKGEGDMGHSGAVATGIAAATVVASPAPPTTTNAVEMMEVDDSSDEKKPAASGDGISETGVVAAGVAAGIATGVAVTAIAEPEPPAMNDHFVKTEAMIESDSMDKKKPAEDTGEISNAGPVAVGAAVGVVAGVAAGVAATTAATPEPPSTNIQQMKTAPEVKDDSLNQKKAAQNGFDSDDDDEILVTVVASPEPEDWQDHEIAEAGLTAAVAGGEPEDWQDHQMHTSHVQGDTATNTNSHVIDVPEEIVGEDVPFLGSESSGSICCEVEPLLPDTPDRSSTLKHETVEGEEKLDMLVKKVSDLEQENTRLSRYGEEMEAFRLRLNQMDSLQKLDAMGGVRGKRPEDDPENAGAVFVKNASDTFAFIMMDPLSLPAFVSWFIFLVQFCSLILLVVSDLYLDRHEASDEYKNKPLFNIPKGVDPTVHAGQGLAIFLVILVQGSLWESTANISLGYNQHLASQGVHFKWWVISNILRLIEGLFATFVTYTLVIKSENVVDLFKDFTAISFVSSFDNIVYNLASMRMLGRRMKRATMKSDDITFKIEAHRSGHEHKSFLQYWCDLSSLRKAVFHPSVFVSATMVSMYTFWAINVLKPHNDGKYLCQQIYVQLDGDVNHELPFFSGSYSLLVGEENVDLYPRYREKKKYYDKHSRDNPPMIFRFCGNMGRWGFAFENRDNPSVECNRDNLVVMSEVVNNQQKYDILDVLQEDWNVFHESSGNWMPLQQYRCECEDRELMHDINEFDICDAIETDEREGPFVTSRTFETKFNTLKFSDSDDWVTVNDHQIYASDEVDGNKDLVLHLGKRWALISSRDLKDFDKSKTTLESYLSEDFHGKYSNYEIAFYSEKILADTPKSVMTAVGLSWVQAVPQVHDESQKPADNFRTRSIFICETCSNDSNPCFYNGICLNDETCYCTSGSSGTLCQVLPTSNGLCDPYFNTREFSFDGGDCCANTCLSSADYTCGKDESQFFYNGFDTCETESCTDCYRKNKSTESINSLVVTYVTLSATGRNLALIEAVTSSVRVYDIDGSSWVMRGSAVTSVINPKSDSVHLSGSDHAITNKDVYGPLSVAVKSGSSFYIYDWKGANWKESFVGGNNTSTNVQKVDFQNNAECLGILYHDHTFKIFNRPNIDSSWRLNNLIVSDLTNRKFLSLSNNGDKLAMANDTCIEIHDLEEDKNSVTCDNFDGRAIMGLQLSPKGHVLAVVVYYEGIKGDLYEYDVRNTMFTKLHSTLRGITSINATVSVSDNGSGIGTHSVADNLLSFYEWKNGIWSSDTEPMSFSSATTSSDQNTFAAISLAKDTSADPVVVYHRNVGCGNGMSRLRSTYIPDEMPFELTLEILEINMNGDVKVLDKMGPSDIPLEMLTQELCVSDDIIIGSQTSAEYCLAIRIIDSGMDGFKAPGHFGVSVNGTKHVSIGSTDGYSNVIHVLGNPSCMSFIHDNHTPWPKKYDVSQHLKCNTMECNWNKVGSISNDNQMIGDPSMKVSSLSADGSIISVSNYVTGLEMVRLFKYSTVGWTQMGQNLTTPDAGTAFGYATAMSANGKSLVASAVNHAVNGQSGVGLVRAYVYNNTSSMWDKRGDDIVGAGQGSFLGYSVSTSADGSVMAVTAKDGSSCHGFVYKFDEEINNWSLWGSCFKEDKAKINTYIKLSSTGSTVAISDYSYARYTGEVRVYSFDDELEDWKQLGNVIQGDADAHFLGRSLSISSDGLVVAASGIFRYPARVYAYNANNDKWEQRGQGITSKGGTYFDVHLAPQGSVLVVASGDNVNVYTYDSVSKLWVESVTEFPPIESTQLTQPSIAVSADALTIATRGQSNVDVYRLKSIGEDGSHCGDRYFFKFTIQPDKFPQDIDWRVQDRRGMDVVGERLSDTPGVRTFMQCLPKNSTYLFDINDMYGDGICCNWGQGSFNVEWDGDLVLSSNDFMSQKTACLPTKNNLTVLALESESFTQGSSWTLTDTNHNILLEKTGVVLSGEKTMSQQCVKTDECLRFGMYNRYAQGFPYSISLVNETVTSCADASNCAGQSPVEKFRFKTINMGECDSKPPACPSGYEFFELEIGQGAFPEDLTWVLLNSTMDVVLRNERYAEVYKYHYHPHCIRASPDECFTFRILSREGYGTSFKVSWDGTTQKELFFEFNRIRQSQTKWGNC